MPFNCQRWIAGTASARFDPLVPAPWLRRRPAQVGWAVLLSDIDIAVLQNPFKFLYRWGDRAGL